jgi:hypothetical protein
MGDRDFCELVAKVWVDMGGDKDGVDHLAALLKEKIAEEVEQRGLQPLTPPSDQ